MPRSFDFAIESPASVEQIHSAFSAQEYWMARLAAYGGGISRLDSLTIDSDGEVNVVIVQNARHDGMPKLVAKFYPSNWQVVQSETWGPIDDGRVRGLVRIDAHGTPGSGVGKAVLEPTRNGSRLECTATVEFKVPLVGGKVESMIGRQLEKQFSVVQSFTTNWIAENA